MTAPRHETILTAGEPMRKIVDRAQPYAFMLHPKALRTFNQNAVDPATTVTQKGVAIHTLRTFIGIMPKGAQEVATTANRPQC